ncbi:MAG: 30S ribosomal protein S16, partial [Endomicrobiia bacterium]
MAVKIRLQRVGKRNQPIFRIVVIEESKKIKGEPKEVIGIYSPIKENIDLDTEKYENWLKKGAQPSDTVKSLYKRVIKKKKV